MSGSRRRPRRRTAAHAERTLADRQHEVELRVECHRSCVESLEGHTRRGVGERNVDERLTDVDAVNDEPPPTEFVSVPARTTADVENARPRLERHPSEEFVDFLDRALRERIAEVRRPHMVGEFLEPVIWALGFHDRHHGGCDCARPTSTSRVDPRPRWAHLCVVRLRGRHAARPGHDRARRAPAQRRPLVAGERGRRLQALQWSAWSPQPGRLGRRVRWQRLERRSTSARPRARIARCAHRRAGGPTQGPAVHPESTPATAPPDQLNRLSPWRRPRCRRPEDRSRAALAIRTPRASSMSSARWLARPRPLAPRR